MAAPDIVNTTPQTSGEALRTLYREWSIPPENLVGGLPKITCQDCSRSARKVCDRHQKKTCEKCGNYLTTAHVDLDYLGHADVTRALLESDPKWAWEPVAWAEDGGPLVRVNGGTAELWIRLTVHGHTRVGVGTAPAGKPEVAKELIGDALRNGAMRFGVALSLWSKEEWEHEPEPVRVSRDQAKNRVLRHLKENGWEKDAAIPKASTLMSSVQGDGPFAESELADVFARAAAAVPEVD